MSSSNTQKEPAFLKPLYPFRAIGNPLDAKDVDCEEVALYELKCPNPECVCAIHTRACNVEKMDEKIRLDSGCPVCKLQFGENDLKGYQFKQGEIVHEVPKNNGRWEGFIIRRLIYVPDDIFQDYGRKLYSKDKEELTRAETDEIAQKFYEEGDWQLEEKKLIAQLEEKFHHDSISQDSSGTQTQHRN